MKKLLALFLALMMVFSMVACSDSKGSDTEEEAASSAEDAAKAYLKAFVARDASDLLDVMPDFMFDYYANAHDLDEDCSKSELVEAMEENAGEEDVDFEIKKVGKSEDYDEDETQEVLEMVAENFDFEDKLDDISKAEIIALECEYEEDGETEEDTVEILCVKIDGKWYAITNK